MGHLKQKLNSKTKINFKLSIESETKRFERKIKSRLVLKNS